MTAPRIVENLNSALHRLCEEDTDLFVLGEDILDPYGGAFKVTRGLASKFPTRVLTTPISESALVGVAGGLALAGTKAIAEVMFGDFIALAFDPLVNFISKSVTMYGHRVPMHFVLRCPTGGHRGYGPTHSQCLQKHLIGIPNLSLYEVTPFHDNYVVLSALLKLGSPCILFEDKGLYTARMLSLGPLDELLQARTVAGSDSVLISSPHFRSPKILLLCHGGMSLRCIAAARDLFLRNELECRVLVPSQLYPLQVNEEVGELLKQSELIFVVEESVEGGTWGAEVAARIHGVAWKGLRRPVINLCSLPSIIPSAPHLERQVLLDTESIVASVERFANAS
jgi:pyruvate/2-oxoglutarate/acetoin dehydrogenase E1 component